MKLLTFAILLSTAYGSEFHFEIINRTVQRAFEAAKEAIKQAGNEDYESHEAIAVTTEPPTGLIKAEIIQGLQLVRENLLQKFKLATRPVVPTEEALEAPATDLKRTSFTVPPLIRYPLDYINNRLEYYMENSRGTSLGDTDAPIPPISCDHDERLILCVEQCNESDDISSCVTEKCANLITEPIDTPGSSDDDLMISHPLSTTVPSLGEMDNDIIEPMLSTDLIDPINVVTAPSPSISTFIQVLVSTVLKIIGNLLFYLMFVGITISVFSRIQNVPIISRSLEHPYVRKARQLIRNVIGSMDKQVLKNRGKDIYDNNYSQLVSTAETV